MEKRYIEIFDSTLRDGAQNEGISFSADDKIKVVGILDSLGVDFIEAGNPASNPKDEEFFNRLKGIKLKNSKLCAFGSTARPNVRVSADKNISALLSAGTEYVSVFGKAWDYHVKKVLNISNAENLRLISEAVGFLTENGKKVIFDAEHFFDGYNSDAEYALEIVGRAFAAGAVTVALCDTNGGTSPLALYNAVKETVRAFPDFRFSVHCHNDNGCAVANSLLAVEAGVSQVQGTLTGIGERCGNADLSSVIPNLVLKYGYASGCKPELLFATCRAAAEIANAQLENSKPFIGASAFAHKGGMHIDGVLKDSGSFEHIDPEAVGNKRKFILSEISGKSSLLPFTGGYISGIDKNSPVMAELLEKLKEKEHYGYHFEAAHASLELFIKRALGLHKKHFDVVFYKTAGNYPEKEKDRSAFAEVTASKTDGGGETTASSYGNGPVNALDLALRKALSEFYPELNGIKLTDYKVRVLEENSTTAARVRVLIETTDEKSSWSTIGVSNDIIEASMLALADAMEYKLFISETRSGI